MNRSISTPKVLASRRPHSPFAFQRRHPINRFLTAVTFFRICVLLLTCGIPGLIAAEREAEWAKVAEARKLDHPKTAMSLLENIEKAAFADQDWAEGTRALTERIALEGKSEDQATLIRKLDTAIATAPEEARPILQAISARWMTSYFKANRWRFAQRGAVKSPVEGNFETYDLTRILKEIDKRLQATLTNEASLKKIPVAEFAELFSKGSLGDAYRPTLYDLVAQAALDFYGEELVTVARPIEAFEIGANSPVFGTVEEFLAWQPESKEKDSPKRRALQIYQSLLGFHRGEAEGEAFLCINFERLRWARGSAVGEVDTLFEKALRRFIAAHAESPVSSWARAELGALLISRKEAEKAHSVFATGAAAFPEHSFGKLCTNKRKELEQPVLNLSTESQWTPAGEEIRVSHRNLKRVWFRAYPLEFDPGSLKSEPTPPLDKTLLEKMLKGKPLKAWDRKLPGDGKYTVHSTLLDSPTDLPDGFYRLVASANESFSMEGNVIAVREIHVTPLGLTAQQRPGGVIEGFVVNAVTGDPLAGVAVDVWTKTNEQTVNRSTRSDEQGRFEFKFKKVAPGLCVVVASRGKQRSVVSTYLYNHEQEGAVKLPFDEDYQSVVFFTDRAIYRPGQTVRFKGIWCRSNPAEQEYGVFAERKCTVVLSDPSRRNIAKLEVKTNRRGSFSGSFIVPEGGVLGQWSLKISGQFFGGSPFWVEEYKRPKFFSEIDAPTEQAALGQVIQVKARAEGYTGAPVDGAKIKWKVVRQTRLPVWARWCWWCPPSSAGSGEIAHGEGGTDEEGSVIIAFKALPDRSVSEDLEPVFDFLVSIDITDAAGETRSAERRISVAYTSLKASITSEEWLESGQEIEFKLRTESHDGEGRPAKGVLKVHRLKEPKECPRGASSQRLENGDRPFVDPADRWAPDELVAELAVETDEEGKALVRQTLERGAYRLVFETKDANGRAVKALRGIEVVDPESDKFPSMKPFFIGVPSWSVKPGQEFELLWGSGHEKARACVEWYQDKELLKREWSAPGRTQQRFTIPIEEKNRGGITVVVWQVTKNRFHLFNRGIEVPWKNKELTIRWEHLVSKLKPGSKESWTAVIEGPDGEAAAAEMVATLYDASLDTYTQHQFMNLSHVLRREWRNLSSVYWGYGSTASQFNRQASFPRPTLFQLAVPFRQFRDEVELLGWSMGKSRNQWMSAGKSRSMMGGLSIIRGAGDFMPLSDHSVMEKPEMSPGTPDLSQVSLRKNLQETAFFFPELTSDEEGKVRMSFTMPEALTKWRFLGLAHDEEMRTGFLEGEFVTSKDLMVQPNPPRFLREGDELEFTVKLTNQSEVEQEGTARLTLADAADDEDRTAALGIAQPTQSFKVPAKESRTLSWRMSVPDGLGFLRYKAVASSGQLSDGEEGWLPVIPRRVLVTESMSLPVRDAGKSEFEFSKLLESEQSETLENRFLHLQVVSQPAWYAVMALPYLMEYPHQGSEQIFNRYYANALAQKIVSSDPKIRRVFDLWKAEGVPLDSPLEKNADLKGIMLEETPWLREAKNDSAARRRVGQLFDENHLNHELEQALRKLWTMQGQDGKWPWFPGGKGNDYITRYVTTGFAKLRELGVKTDITPALRALRPLDADLTRTYEDLKKNGQLKRMNLSPRVVHHLYTRTFFLKDKALTARDQVAFDYFVAQAREHWVKLGSRMSRAHVALALHRLGDEKVPKLVTHSLKENAKITKDQGMFWKDSPGWSWSQAPIETQAMMIEAFREIDGDAQAVEDCQVWLIKQKQVSDWKTTKATSDAVHALLLGGRNLLGPDDLLEVSLGGTKIEPRKVEAGTGFFETRFVADQVKPEQGKVEVDKSSPGVAWASLHWQYLEDLGKITSHEGRELELEKQLFVRRNTDQGKVLEPVKGPLEPGDELVTRLVLRNDRAMEFVHLKDQRGSGTEPVNRLSGQRSQDGFGYYEVTRDTASHFFIDRLPAGTHVFETSVRVQHRGRYQTGIAEIRCLYAPEFAAHSASLPMEVN